MKTRNKLRDLFFILIMQINGETICILKRAWTKAYIWGEASRLQFSFTAFKWFHS